MVMLVTGGSGFIGSHVVDALIKEGYNVRIFDKINPKRDDVDWFKGDLLNERDTIEACRDVEAVFHLAAVADVNVAHTHPEQCLLVNELGTLNMLKASMAQEVERFVLASTTWVYGKTEGIVDESTRLPMPDHIYSKTKIGQEQLVTSWYNQYKVPAYTILRYGIPYGPRMRSNMVIAIFVRRAMQKKPITLFGEGDQGRHFIYVLDLAEAHIKALHENGKNEIFNIAGTEFVTIKQIVDYLQEYFGDMVIKKEPPRPGDFKGVRMSVEKAAKLINWVPKTTFKEGLIKYIEYVKEHGF